MKLILDENVHASFAPELGRRGHDVIRVGRELPTGARDAVVLRTAVLENRILLTNDEDYGELVFRDGLEHAGIVYMRLHRLTLVSQLELIERALRLMETTPRPYLVLTPSGPRVG